MTLLVPLDCGLKSNAITAGLRIKSATYNTASATVLLDIRVDYRFHWLPATGCSLQGVASDTASGRNLCFTAKLPFCLCL